MKRFSEQFNTKAQTVKLTKAERADLKDRLVSYMEYHPLPSTMRQEASASAAEPFILWRFNTLQFRAAGSMVALLVLLVIPFAAERSVPGDVLYPVKVQFNEEVRSTLALSPYQKVEWETKRLERRLSEARLLAAEGKLTDEIEADVAQAVKDHTAAAQASIAVLRQSDEEEAAIAEIAFASALEVESEVLATSVTGDAQADTAAITLAIADARAVSAPTKAVSYERLLARVEEETTQAYELIETVRGSVSILEAQEIERRLADVERKIAAAIELETTAVAQTEATIASEATSSALTTVTELHQTDTVSAQQLLREALRDTQTLIRFMGDLNIKNTVSIEELVPVTPTDDETARLMVQQLTETEALLVTVRPQVAGSEKLSYGVANIAALTTQASSSYQIAAYQEALAFSTEALTIAKDLVAIVAGETDFNTEAVILPPPTATTTEVVSTSTVAASSTAEASTDETTAEEAPEVPQTIVEIRLPAVTE